MLDLFKTKNKKDSFEFYFKEEKITNIFHDKISKRTIVSNFFTDFGGTSYNKGLFRLHNKSSSFFWTNLVGQFFPKYKDKICCFAYDWMGCQYGINLANENIIYLFDPAVGKVFEVEQNLLGFLNEELVDYREETLDSETFIQLLKKTKINLLPSNECFGFKKLLFLGGNDEFKNLEIYDMEVYWDINYQVYNKIQNLEEGTIINKIDLE